jgi:hypothetical protein
MGLMMSQKNILSKSLSRSNSLETFFEGGIIKAMEKKGISDGQFQKTEKIAEIRPSIFWMNVVSIFPPLILLMFYQMTGIHANLIHNLAPHPWLKLLSIFVVLIVTHELIHGIAVIMWGGLSRQDIKFGFQWKYLAFFAHPKKPVRLWVYRRVLLAPLLVQSIIVNAVFIIYPSVILEICALTAVCFAGGDIYVFLSLITFKPNLVVEDLALEIGCDLYSDV